MKRLVKIRHIHHMDIASKNGMAVVDRRCRKNQSSYQEYIDCKSTIAAAKKAGIDKTHSL